MLAFALKCLCSFHKSSDSLGLFTFLRIKFALYSHLFSLRLFVFFFVSGFCQSDFPDQFP